MRTLVTGGGGFIGTNLMKRLLKDGHEVISLDNYCTGFKENEQKGCTYIHGDVRDLDFWGRRLEKDDMMPDIIFHMAALPRIKPSFENPSEVMETNMNGTLNVLEYARRNDIPVIYAGSSSFHGIKIHIHLVNGKVKNYVKCMVTYLELQHQFVDFTMFMVII